MTKRLSKYSVWVYEEDNDLDNMEVTEGLAALPGYYEHEWVDWVDE